MGVYDNNQRVKPIYLVETNVKKKPACYLCFIFDIGPGNVHFVGREVNKDFEFGTEEELVKIMEEEDLIEKYLPWQAIVDVTVRRVNKDRLSKLQSK